MSEQCALFFARDPGEGGTRRSFARLVNEVESPRPIPVLATDATGLTESLSDERHAHVLPGPSTTGPWFLRWLNAPLALWLRTRGLTDLVNATGASAVVSFRHRSHVIAMLARPVAKDRTPVVLCAYETLSQHLPFEHGPVARAFYEWFAYRFFRQADLLVATCRGVAGDLEERFGVPADRIEVVPLPVDVERVRALSAELVTDWPDLPPGTPVILGVGTLTRAKGFDVLVRALSRLAAHVNAHVVLIGEGPESARLEQLARSRGVGERLHLLGRSDNPWAYMRRADVLAVPSRTEGLPTVVNEAHALGLPVVAAHCSAGVGEALENGAAGMLAAPEDAAVLADALTRTLEDGALAARLIAGGHERVASLRPETATARFAELLEGVIRKAAERRVETGASP